jgi:excinuclease ABC subunit C
MVDLVRMFLANRRGELAEALGLRIQLASDGLDFETAAYWRDILASIESYWSKPRWNAWADGDVVDTFEIDHGSDGLRIYLVTQRGRYVLGRKVFSFGSDVTLADAISRIIRGFYQAYAPREIRVSHDFEGRNKLAKYLSEKFDRTIQIGLITRNSRRVTTSRAVQLTRNECELDAAKPPTDAATIGGELKRTFDLIRAPRRVECFDVAHISGTGVVASWSVWIGGHFVGSEYGIRVSNESSELAALAEAVMFRLSKTPRPAVIVLDGSRPQLNAVSDALRQTRNARVVVIAAAKPTGHHSGVAYFLMQSGERIEFDESSPSQNMLKILRDDAHDLANRAHRDLRDLRHNYELASILPSINEAERRALLRAAGSINRLITMPDKEILKLASPAVAKKISKDIKVFRAGRATEVLPLIVPIRFYDENGSADDLRPIATR